MSSSPEKLGRSSKSRTKSPCSPQAVGLTEAEADVLLTESVVGMEVELMLIRPELEEEVSLDGEAVVDVELLIDVELEAKELELEESKVTVVELGAWPFASEVPVEDNVSEPAGADTRLDEVPVAGPFASELPMIESSVVLGVAETRLVLLPEEGTMLELPEELAPDVETEEPVELSVAALISVDDSADVAEMLDDPEPMLALEEVALGAVEWAGPGMEPPSTELVDVGSPGTVAGAVTLSDDGTELIADALFIDVEGDEDSVVPVVLLAEAGSTVELEDDGPEIVLLLAELDTEAVAMLLVLGLSPLTADVETDADSGTEPPVRAADPDEGDIPLVPGSIVGKEEEVTLEIPVDWGIAGESEVAFMLLLILLGRIE